MSAFAGEAENFLLDQSIAGHDLKRSLAADAHKVRTA